MIDDTMADETQQDQAPRQHHQGSYHHSHERRDHRQQQQQRPAPVDGTQPPEDAKAPDGDLDAEEDEHDQAPRRQHSRGGRPPKKVYEEFINDPYCE